MVRYKQVNDIHNKLPGILRLVAQAEAVIMQFYAQGDIAVELKSDDSPLTQADIASHRILVAGLQKLFPYIPVVSEEGDQAQNAQTVQEDMFWLVDPIDGTKEFIAHTDEFTVCLALVRRGEPVFGIISAPALGLTYYGGPGMGAYKKARGADAVQIHVAPKAVGIVLGSRSHPEPATATYIATYYADAKIKAVGSQLKLPYIAEGLADACPRFNTTMKPWDLAAGQAILHAAGGYVTRPDGTPIDYSDPSLRVGDFIAYAHKK